MVFAKVFFNVFGFEKASFSANIRLERRIKKKKVFRKLSERTTKNNLCFVREFGLVYIRLISIAAIIYNKQRLFVGSSNAISSRVIDESISREESDILRIRELSD